MTPEQRAALQKAALAAAETRLKPPKGGIPEGATLLATTDDGGRVYRAQDGSQGFVGPVMSSTDPDTVARILAGATPAEVSRGNMQREAGADGSSRLRAALSGSVQGATFGYSDELAGAVAAGGAAVTGGDPGQAYRDTTNRARGMIDADAEAFPGTTIAANIAGAVGTGLAAPVGAVTTVRGAATAGAGTAVLDAAGRSEGSVGDRLSEAVWMAPLGAAMGAAGGAAGKALPRILRRTFSAANKRPSLETLKAAKNQAYAAVRRSGEVFDEVETTELGVRVLDLAGDVFADADPQTVAAIKNVELRAGKAITLDELDKLRQVLWSRYNRGEEPVIIDMIGEIDAMIAKRAESNEVMNAARLANSQYSKAKLLEGAFLKARRQTASTGSGGNILNKYKQAVASILSKPHEAKWFSQEEIAMMDSFIFGDNAENTLRQVGKLSPSGNGLMTALNVYAATVDPAMLTVTAAGAAAKNRADASGMAGSERLLKAVSTGVVPAAPTPTNLNPLAAAAGVGANEVKNVLGSPF